MAFAELFPDGILFVDHSVASGGYYCQVGGRNPLSESEIEELKVHMQKLVDSDLPFERKEVPLQQAIEYFRSRGYEDKVHLLKYRKRIILPSIASATEWITTTATWFLRRAICAGLTW